jgi:hypothetical protein
MADLNLSATTGLTATAQLYLGSSSVGTPIAMTEIGTTGEYSANMPASTAAGTYLVVFLSAGAKVAAGSIVWDGTKEVLSATQSSVDAIATKVNTLNNADLSGLATAAAVSALGSPLQASSGADISAIKDSVLHTQTVIDGMSTVIGG